MKINLYRAGEHIVARSKNCRTYKMNGGEYLSGIAFEIKIYEGFPQITAAITQAMKEAAYLMEKKYYPKQLVRKQELNLLGTYDTELETLRCKDRAHKTAIQAALKIVHPQKGRKSRHINNVTQFPGGYADVRG